MASMGNECRQTLLSAQYAKCGFTSGVCDFSLVVDRFRRKQCDGTIQETDISEDLVMDG